MEDSSGRGGSGTAVGSATIAVDVQFTLVTPDKLRKVEFGLTKSVEGTDILWTIRFELFERGSAIGPFPDAPEISLTVKVNPALNARAEAAAKGLSPHQEAQATGPAAVAVRAANANPVLHPIACAEVQKVVE
jgi:hypothetical protein